MQHFKARHFLTVSLKDIWELENVKEIEIEFDDGEVLVCPGNETIFSRYFWEFHREFPITPLLSKHHLSSLVGSGDFNRNMVGKLLNTILWDTYDANPDVPVDTLARRTYYHYNVMYNDMVMKTEVYVGSLNALDFVNIIRHPKIAAINDAAEPNEKSIAQTHKQILELIKTEPDLQNNALAKAARYKTVKEPQMLQCVSVRGYLTDTNSHRFMHPIMRGYAMGFRRFHDSFIESRSSAKSLEFSKANLQKTEYFSRRLQLMTMTLRRVHRCDCGSQHYLEWLVTKKGFIHVVGKYYLDEESGKLKIVQYGDTHLVGQTLKFRSTMGCQHDDPDGVCSVCHGEVSIGIYETNNLGNQCTISMCAKAAQNVLSTKHLDGTTVIKPLEIEPRYKRFVSEDKDGLSYLLVKQKGRSFITVDKEEAANLPDIFEIDNVSDLDIYRVSSLKKVLFRTIQGKLETNEEVRVDFENRASSLTYQALEYIKATRFTVDERGHYVIDLADWNYSEPFMTLPMQQYNMGDHNRDLAALIESRVVDLKKRDKFTNPAMLLRDFHDLANEKLDVHLSVLEAILYGVMIVSAEENNYKLPKPGGPQGFGVMKRVMAMRSLSCAFAFQGHRDVILSPLTYLVKDRPDHPYDAVLMPREVIYNIHQ
jgi:hypothetical protein